MVGTCIKAVKYHIIAELYDLRFLEPGQKNDSGADFLAKLCGLDRLRSVALVAGQHDDGILAEVLRCTVNELIAAHPCGAKRYGFLLHERLCRIKSAEGTAAAHKVDGLHAALILFLFDNLCYNILDVLACVTHCILLVLRKCICLFLFVS